MPNWTTAIKNAMIEAGIVPGTTYYLALFTADPGISAATEVTGGSYVRQEITFADPATGEEKTSDTQVFTGMPAVSGDLYVGLLTDETGGTPFASSPTVAVIGPVAAGAEVTFPTEAILAKIAG